MDDRESLQRLLSRARRAVRIINEEIATYQEQEQSVPADLQIEIEEKQAEIVSLESRLTQLDDDRGTTFLDNLPMPSSFFVGRITEMKRCLQALTPEERTWGVVIDGPPGMGKTSLALKVAQIARRHAWFDSYLYVCAKTNTLDHTRAVHQTLALSALDSFVSTFARLMGNETIIRMSDAGQRRRVFLENLHGRRMLFVLDNLETLPEEERDLIADFLRTLPAPNKAIITNHYRPGESGVIINLEPLSDKEMVEFSSDMGRRNPFLADELAHTDMSLRRELAEQASGNLLIIHQVLGMVMEKDSTFLQAVNRLMNAAQSSSLTLHEALLEDMLGSIGQSERIVLSALMSLHTPVATATLTEITGLPISEIDSVVERLLALRLILDARGGYYILHQVTRSYLFDRREDTSLFDKDAYRRALRHWVAFARSYGGESNRLSQSFDLLRRAWFHLESAATALHDLATTADDTPGAESARMLNELSLNLRVFLRFHKYWDEWGKLSEWAYEAAKLLGDWHSAGWRAYDVAFIYWNRTKTEQADQWAQAMTEVTQKGDNERDRIIATRLRGLVAEQRGALDEAEQLYSEALEASRIHGKETDEASILNDLGDLSARRQNYERANTCYQDVLAIMERLDDKESQALYSGKLALLNLDRKRYAEARPWCERELALAKEVKRPDLLAQAQIALARVLDYEGDYAEALSMAEQALALRERMGQTGLKAAHELVNRLREQQQLSKQKS